MGYQIDVRKDGDLIDSFAMPAEYVVELMMWRQRTAQSEEARPQEPVKAEPEKLKSYKGGAPAGKVRYCSNCRRPGHRADACKRTPSEEADALGNVPIGMVDASAFIRIRSKRRMGMDDEDIMADEEVTLAQINCVVEAKSWKSYRNKFPH